MNKILQQVNTNRALFLLRKVSKATLTCMKLEQNLKHMLANAVKPQKMTLISSLAFYFVGLLKVPR